MVDCEWAGSDRPAIITGHSCLHIMDLDMRHATSPIDNWQLAGMCAKTINSNPQRLCGSSLTHEKEKKLCFNKQTEKLQFQPPEAWSLLKES